MRHAVSKIGAGPNNINELGGVDITAHRVRDGSAPTAEYERGAKERLAAPNTLDQQGSGHDETEQIGPRVLYE